VDVTVIHRGVTTENAIEIGGDILRKLLVAGTKHLGIAAFEASAHGREFDVITNLFPEIVGISGAETLSRMWWGPDGKWNLHFDTAANAVMFRLALPN
jgi:hypothetical protein